MLKCTEEKILGRAAQGIVEPVFKMIDVVRNEVRKVTVFRVAPDELNWIQLRSIRRQPFEFILARRSLKQFLGRRAMSIQPIQYHKKIPSKAPTELREKILHLFLADVFTVHHEVEPQALPFRRHCDCRDHGEPVVTIPALQNWCLSARSPRPANQRLQHEAAFIHQHQALAGSTGFFLHAANDACAIPARQPHSVPSLAARASGDSNQVASGSERRVKGHRSRQTRARSCPPRGVASTGPSRNRWHAVQPKAVRPVVGDPHPTSETAHRGVASKADLLCPRVPKRSSIGSRHPGSRLDGVPLHRVQYHPQTTWPQASVLPQVLSLFRALPCLCNNSISQQKQGSIVVTPTSS